MDDDLLKQFRDEQIITAPDARNSFSEIIERSFRYNERILLVRRGKPMAIVVSLNDLGHLRQTQSRDELIRSIVDAHNQFSDTINWATFGHQRVVLTKHKQQVAAIVPIEDYDLLPQPIIRDTLSTAFTAVDARTSFSEVVHRSADGKERIGITRHGRLIAAIIPIEDLRLVEQYERDVEAGKRPAIKLAAGVSRLKH